MEDFALVLNAGSSSLKFCTFERPEAEKWRMAVRGQIEGIGTTPRLYATDASGEKLADQSMTFRDGREAVDALAAWLRTKYCGSRVLGVGHRVVHGGSHFTAPTMVDSKILEQLRELIHWLRFISPTISRPSKQRLNECRTCRKVACFDTVFIVGNRWRATCPASIESPQGRIAAIRFSWTVL
jgi:acetate kinase